MTYAFRLLPLLCPYYNIPNVLTNQALLRLTLRSLLLHTLTSRSLTSQLLYFAVSIGLRLSVLAGGLHVLDGLIFLLGARGLPLFAAGDVADRLL